MNLILTPEEIRVLGCLIEKDMATPDYYPLSLNALVNACNQKNNRDPIVHYDDTVVEATLSSLRSKQLVMVFTGAGYRVPKYGHRASETLNVNNRELAVLAVLMLRGAQTVNEIRTRASSLHPFDDEESVGHVLERLAERQMAVLLGKLPGMREPRWTHLLAGEPVLPPAEAPAPSAARESQTDRLARLETAVESLRQELEALRDEFAAFRRQFQ